MAQSAVKEKEKEEKAQHSSSPNKNETSRKTSSHWKQP
jgi:hypothetical protein